MIKQKDVTEFVKSIFGEEIVDYAYEMTKYSSGNSIIDKHKIHPEGGCPIFIRLKNGKMFSIWASEWGGINSIDNEKQWIMDQNR